MGIQGKVILCYATTNILGVCYQAGNHQIHRTLWVQSDAGLADMVNYLPGFAETTICTPRNRAHAQLKKSTPKKLQLDCT
jgi:hypothetical protein